MIYDVIIIGGGASGLCAAIRIKQQNSALKVAVLEKLPRVGKKLAATGNGRCNITNADLSENFYHGENSAFSEWALSQYDNKVCENFFFELGVPFVFEEGGKAYPASFQAASVVDAMRFRAAELQVEILTETAVTGINISRNSYSVISENDSWDCSALIVAVGLYSGGDKLGCDGKILGMLKALGYKTVKTTPAIVQLKTETDMVRQLKGIKVNADVSLKCNGKTVRREYGETLFCDYGISGPPVLQISRAVSRLDGRLTVSLDLFPDTDYNALEKELTERVKRFKNRSLDEFFTGMLHKKCGQVVLKISGCALSEPASTLDDKKIRKLVQTLKKMEFTVTGTTGFLNSQVTAGGLDTTMFDDKTMMSKKHEGLFCIGEILDIDGDCGGYNLQWAWSSAMCAADAVCKLLEM